VARSCIGGSAFTATPIGDLSRQTPRRSRANSQPLLTPTKLSSSARWQVETELGGKLLRAFAQFLPVVGKVDGFHALDVDARPHGVAVMPTVLDVKQHKVRLAGEPKACLDQRKRPQELLRGEEREVQGANLEFTSVPGHRKKQNRTISSRAEEGRDGWTKSSLLEPLGRVQ
jgi:hypothetical protein